MERGHSSFWNHPSRAPMCLLPRMLQQEGVGTKLQLHREHLPSGFPGTGC